MAEWTSATGSADENVDISAPDAGVYRVFVDVFSGSTAFNLNAFSVPAGAGAGAFHATPAAVAGVQGVPVGYTLAWTGLAPMTEYLGLVTYGDTAKSTAVSVSSGEAPVVAPANTALPTITGKLRVGKTLTATPGAWDTDGLAFSYRWMRNGGPVKATATVKVGSRAYHGDRQPRRWQHHDQEPEPRKVQRLGGLPRQCQGGPGDEQFAAAHGELAA